MSFKEQEQVHTRIKQNSPPAAQAVPADGGDHGGEGEQDHHLRGDQEAL